MKRPPVLPVSVPPLAWFSFGRGALRSVILPTLLLAGTVWTCDYTAIASAATADPAPAPSLLLARYTAGLEKIQPSLERRTVVLDIEASLPKVSKHASLQAIRRWIPFDGPEYHVLQSEGDRTVRQQVIARYLSVESQAETKSDSSVAVSPANYKFHYICSIGTGGTLTYVYQITPRRKRVGFIQGELWIDVSTGIAVRKAGHLVKSPSMFVRRVNVQQYTDIREGRPYLRITRLEIDTRLVGRAELTIQERPCATSSNLDIAALGSKAKLQPMGTTQERENDVEACSVDR
jgi:hypothetical protein